MEGTVKRYWVDREYGYLTYEDDGEECDIVFYPKEEQYTIGQAVSFDIRTSKAGNKYAYNIMRIAAPATGEGEDAAGDISWELFFDTPVDGRYDVRGSNPELLDALTGYIDERIDKIRSIDIALFLSNNEFLRAYLEGVAQRGIAVTVVSIPLEGYDETPFDLYDTAGGTLPVRKGVSKLDLAQEVYGRFGRGSAEELDLIVFPHEFVKSERVFGSDPPEGDEPADRGFARGLFPYSLHTKSILIEYYDGTGAIGVSSCNFAVRDEPKHQVLFFMEASADKVARSRAFFDALCRNAVTVDDADDADGAHYPIDVQSADACEDDADAEAGNIYTAPFLRGSNTIADERLAGIVESAQRRIFICSQHIGWDGTLPSFLPVALRRCGAGVPLRLLSQTYIDANGKKPKGIRAPKNKRAFRLFAERVEALAKGGSNVLYYVNGLVHAKFIVVDDTAIISTSNYTPTSFDYIEDVSIPAFIARPDLSYEGVFSEVGQFTIVKDAELADALVAEFEKMRALPGTSCEIKRNNA